MPAAFRDAASSTGALAVATGTIPAATANGDTMVAFLDHAASTATMTTPAVGWTLEVADPNPADFSCLCYSRVKQAGDVNPAWTWSAAGNWAVDILSCSGVLNINQKVGVIVAGANAIALGPLTPGVANCLLVGWASTDATGAARTWTQDGAMTEVLDRLDAEHHRAAAYELLSGGSGVAQTRTFTVSGTVQDLAGFLLVLAPVPDVMPSLVMAPRIAP